MSLDDVFQFSLARPARVPWGFDLVLGFIEAERVALFIHWKKPREFENNRKKWIFFPFLQSRPLRQPVFVIFLLVPPSKKIYFYLILRWTSDHVEQQCQFSISTEQLSNASSSSTAAAREMITDFWQKKNANPPANDSFIKIFH